MNDPELYQRLARAENQIQALNRSLIAAYKLLHHISLQLPDQATGIHDRTLINNHIQALETLKPRTRKG
jgi:PleD family two-component response regulator